MVWATRQDCLPKNKTPRGRITGGGAGKRIRFAWSQASCMAREDNVAHDEQVVLRETM